jgi:ribosome-binding protein aMBF1 (putative translation factor)
VIVRVFVKKTEKTPRREIDLALSRAKSVDSRGGAMARISSLHKKWMKEPKYKKAYEALEEEFVLASAVMDVRNRAGLTQVELARKMGTTQPVVARLESGRTRPSMRTLERLAKATGSRLLIRFEPRDAKRTAG